MSQSADPDNLIDRTAFGLPDLVIEFRHRLDDAGLMAVTNGWWLYEDQHCCLHKISVTRHELSSFLRRRLLEVARRSINIENDLIDRGRITFYACPLPPVFVVGVSALCCIVLPTGDETLDSPIGRIARGCEKIVAGMSERAHRKSNGSQLHQICSAEIASPAHSRARNPRVIQAIRQVDPSTMKSGVQDL
jgi:hypothetical protein